MIRYDTIEEFIADLKADCDQLNLAHVGDITYKKMRKTKNKTNAGQCPLSTGSISAEAVRKEQEDYNGGKDL